MKVKLKGRGPVQEIDDEAIETSRARPGAFYSIERTTDEPKLPGLMLQDAADIGLVIQCHDPAGEPDDFDDAPIKPRAKR